MRKSIIILIAFALILGGCEEFLTPKNKSEILENELFKDKEGVEDALYGIYTSIASPELYGVNLPKTLDILAQYYEIPMEPLWYTALTTYQHTKTEARTQYTPLWENLYAVIGEINNFLNKLENYQGEPLVNEKLYRGEALGLRAYLHFDLLRMFAPLNLKARGIPYVVRYTKNVTPFSTVEKCYEKIIGDLTEAEALLKEDEAMLKYPRLRAHDEIMRRNREVHFNLYAVRATLARVYWTRNTEGDLEKAGKYAEALIATQKFPLADKLDIQNLTAGIVAESEAIWGLSNTVLFPLLKNIFVNEGRDACDPAPSYKDLYYHNTSGQDYRFNNWFRINKKASVGGFKIRCMKLINPKDLDISDEAPKGLAGVNQIRIPEMYLIATEANIEKDYDKALEYFERYIASRGLGSLDGKLSKEHIDREWRKEFISEGQVWFLMKRRQLPEIRSVHTKNDIRMTEELWQMSIPLDEFEYRDESTM